MWIFGSPKLDSNMDGITAPILHWDPIASTFAQLLPHLDTQHCSHQVSQDWPWIARSFASKRLWVDVIPSKWENGSMELAMCQSKQKCQKCFHAMQIDGSITNWCYQTHAMQILLVWYFWQHPLPAGGEHPHTPALTLSSPSWRLQNQHKTRMEKTPWNLHQSEYKIRPHWNLVQENCFLPCFVFM